MEPELTPTTPPPVQVVEHHIYKKNIYPGARHIILTILVLCIFLILVFLMYQNGKSIYDNGL